MGWLGAMRATGVSTDADSSKRSGAVRVAEGTGGGIEGKPLIDVTLVCYEREVGHGKSLVLGPLQTLCIWGSLTLEKSFQS
jgi:hypothetical protein